MVIRTIKILAKSTMLHEIINQNHLCVVIAISHDLYDPSLNCRKRQLRPQHSRLLGNSRKFTFVTLQTAISHFKSRKMHFFSCSATRDTK